MNNEFLKEYQKQSSDLFSPNLYHSDDYLVYAEATGSRGKMTVRDQNCCEVLDCDEDPKGCCGGIGIMILLGACGSAIGCL